PWHYRDAGRFCETLTAHRSRMRLSFTILAALFVVGAFSGCPPRSPAPRTPGATPPPPPAPTPVSALPPPPYAPNKRMDVGRMFNGAQVRTQLETDYGA